MTLRVLLVEDSATMLTVLDGLCSSIENVQVVGTATSEHEATEWLERNVGGWDLAVFDLVLEMGGSGFNLISRAKRQPGAGRVVVLSAFATDVIEDRCRGLGAEAAFQKAEMGAFAQYLRAVAAVDVD